MKHDKKHSAKAGKRAAGISRGRTAKKIPTRGARGSRNAADNSSRGARGGASISGRCVIMRGRIQGSAKGFGFFIPDDGSEDLFVAAKHLNGAMHNDIVEAKKISNRRGAGEAEVVSVTERGSKLIVGTFEEGADCGYVVPDGNNYAYDILIPSGCCGKAANGEKVLVEITDFASGRMPRGRIAEVIGLPGQKGTDVLGVVLAHGLRTRFPRKVTAAAAAIPQTVDESALSGRRDFRRDTVITIDGSDSKDFDDAVSVRRDGGDFILSVHIADVSEYVKAGDPIDKEAMLRGTSVYLCDRVYPMLPEQLSNGICSLNEGVDRLTLSVTARVGGDGKVKSSEICRGVIRSKARMTYEKTARILEGDAELNSVYAFLRPMLDDLKALADARTRFRLSRGAISFDLRESLIKIDSATGRATDVSEYPKYVSNRIIEECMLIANEAVAERFTETGCPFVYRVHAAPPPEKLEAFIDYLSALGITFKGGAHPQPKDFAELMESLDPSVRPAVSRVALRTMSKAEYKTQDLGHFGLAAPYYCHFTSPIRRYPDLAIHRIIKDWLDGGESRLGRYADFVKEVARTSSFCEREAEAVERETDELKKAEFMSDKIGREYEGTVSGVTEWGLFVELDNTVEGLIRTETLPGGGYNFNERLMRTDNRTHSFRIGDRVKIRVDGVRDGKVAFTLKED